MKKTYKPTNCWTEVESALSAGVDRLILFGPPGTGKTYAGLNMGQTRTGAYRLVCTDDMTNAEVTGAWMPNANGTWKWNEGQAIKAWRGDGQTGGRLVIDEIDKAGGDVFATLLAMTDSVESARWENPETGETVSPNKGFSVVMTTNIEHMDELPMALKDRFPVAIRIDKPHPQALERLSPELRSFAEAMADADQYRRISLRAFFAFDQLRKTLGDAHAANIVFGRQDEAILDALDINKKGEASKFINMHQDEDVF